MAVKKITTRSNTLSTPSVLTVAESETLFDRMMRDVHDMIAEHAYYLGQQRGFGPGNDLDDWFRAESDLFRAIPVEFTEDDNELKVLAEVPGYTAEDIDVHLEPTRLVIRGKNRREEHGQKQNIAYSERQESQLFRALHLPVEVDPEKASASVRDGILELTLPKTQTARAKRVQVKAA